MNSILDRANLDNLIGLWHALGARLHKDSKGSMWISESWPHKCWRTQMLMTTSFDFSEFSDRLIFPIWDIGNTEAMETALVDHNYEISSEQTAMVLAASEWPRIKAPRDEFTLRKIDKDIDVETWSHVCGAAFDYRIDPAPIRKLLRLHEACLFLAFVDGEPAGTALLFKTNRIAGIHQVGVTPAFQGRGIAREMMKSIIREAAEAGAEHITLQASRAGRHLYDQLGFTAQFGIRNYKRPIQQ